VDGRVTATVVTAPARARPALLEQVRGRSGAYFPDLGPVRRLRVVARQQRPYSEVLRVRLEGGEGRARDVIVKVAQAAERQFDAMRHARSGFAADGTLLMPRALDYLPDGPAVVMESLPGTPLAARIRRALPWGASRRAAAARCAQAGRWLALYHAATTDASPRPLDGGTKWDFLLESLASLGHAGVDPALLRRLLAGLRPTAAEAFAWPRPVARLHGDFTADNILVDGARMIGIDVWGTFVNTVDHDLASFLNSLHLLRIAWPLPGPSLDRLERAFLGGYCPGETEQSAATLVLRVIGLADVGLEILSRRRGRAARAWVRRVLTASLAACAGAAARWAAPGGGRG
jgi:hypothetical protein